MASPVITHNDILRFWFPDGEFQDYWFSNAMDHDIRIRFGDTLRQAEEGKLDDWVEGKDSVLALIIILDQFTRNIHRRGDFRKNDTKAFNLAMSLVSSGAVNSYPINQRIFIYLPLRHQRTSPLLDLVMAHIRSWEATELTDIEANIVRRFKTATIKDYSKVTDTIITSDTESPMFTNVGYVVDDICSEYKEIDTGLLSAKTRETFDAITGLPIYATLIKFIHKNFGDSAVMCISLSGGVDSMWLSIMLKVAETRGDIKKVVAVHVDYANRKESNDEASFVVNWANFLGITICYRRIEHIKRGKDGIDSILYEGETKKIRFNLYRYVMEKYGVMGVILGHHGDDIDENVIMNLLRGNDILNLNGMTEIQDIEGVNICRPLLPHPKKDIYDASHEFQVPYLKDTTSEACDRGFVRKTLVPSIMKHSELGMRNIKLAGKRSDEWCEIIEKLVFKPMVEKVTDVKHGFMIPYNPDHSGLPHSFWAKYYVTIFHARGIRMCSHKNLDGFIVWFNRGCSGMYRFNNGLIAFIDCDMLKFVDYSLVNHVDKRDRIAVNIGDPFEVNGWKVSVEDAKDEDRCEPVTTLDVMKGEYTYYLHQVDPTATHFCCTYGKGKDRNMRRHFKGCTTALKYVPKYRVPIKDGSTRTFKITAKFVT